MTDRGTGGGGAEPHGTRVECLSCGRLATLGAGRGGTLPLVELTRRLRCSACGSRAVRADRFRTPRDVARRLGERLRGGGPPAIHDGPVGARDEDSR